VKASRRSPSHERDGDPCRQPIVVDTGARLSRQYLDDLFSS
jgi:hypothetical protein